MMGARMKLKVGKYWMEEKELNPKLNKILYIAAILDPRQKMRHVEKCLKKKLKTTDLDLYLQEKQYKEVIRKENENLVVDKFDILGWWSSHHGKLFPILSEMAREILAIPISTVASKSAFSTGGRVLNDFRTSLSPQVVEVVICCEDWLRSSPVTPFIADEEELPEDEQDKEYQMNKYFVWTCL
ncbi:Zinc finger BED domain-containing protein RICESLEEPER 2 [Linum grandiflorum]